MRALVLVALAGCGSKVNPAYCAKHDTDHRYCPWDASVDTVDSAPLCLGSGTFALCVDGPTMSLALPDDLDTDLSPLCAATQPAMWKANGQLDACFVSGTSVTGGNVVAHGGRPLVIMAADTITVTGIDAASHLGNPTTGAGYAPSTCSMVARTPVANSNGGGGGAGGTFFGTAGGAGGNGGTGGGGLPAMTVTTATMLRGGCAGSDGAAGTQPGGTAGAGGGALYLLAADKIDLTGATINASGGGGGAGDHDAGGGGGGAGGMIVLVAATIGASGAVILANGGSGGGGGNTVLNGDNGADPSPMTPTTAALGGTPAVGGGAGGNGFAGSSVAQPGGNGNGGDGGGGGGGGGGYIQANHPLATTMVSPTPVIM